MPTQQPTETKLRLTSYQGSHNPKRHVFVHILIYLIIAIIVQYLMRRSQFNNSGQLSNLIGRHVTLAKQLQCRPSVHVPQVLPVSGRYYLDGGAVAVAHLDLSSLISQAYSYVNTYNIIAT